MLYLTPDEARRLQTLIEDEPSRGRVPIAGIRTRSLFLLRAAVAPPRACRAGGTAGVETATEGGDSICQAA
jgi:hypothetical protein